MKPDRIRWLATHATAARRQGGHVEAVLMALVAFATSDGIACDVSVPLLARTTSLDGPDVRDALARLVAADAICMSPPPGPHEVGVHVTGDVCVRCRRHPAAPPIDRERWPASEEEAA